MKLDTKRRLSAGVNSRARARNIFNGGFLEALRRLLLSMLQNVLDNLYIFGSPEYAFELLFRWCPQETLRSLIGMVDVECYVIRVLVMIRILQIYLESLTVNDLC